MSAVHEMYLSRIRDGDPVALAALCAQHGSAVLAYCEQVTSPSERVAAAAEVFARFRVTDAASAEPGGIEARLLQLARRDGVDAQAAGAGERAFAQASRAALPRDVASEIVCALVDAAPLRAPTTDPIAVRETTMRLIVHGGTTGRAAESQPAEQSDTVAPAAPGGSPPPASAPRATAPDPPAPAERSDRRRSLVMTVVAVVAASAGMIVINSLTADDSPVGSSPATSGGAGQSSRPAIQSQPPAAAAGPAENGNRGVTPPPAGTPTEPVVPSAAPAPSRAAVQPAEAVAPAVAAPRAVSAPTEVPAPTPPPAELEGGRFGKVGPT